MLLALLAAAAIVAPAGRDVVDPIVLRSTIIDMHADERGRVGSPPLSWSDDLADEAAVWAGTLAASGRFEHDPSNEDHGENLWMGTRGYYTLRHMITGWSEEKSHLRGMRSWEDDHHRVGHYTQMVWKDTRSVGCAIARNRTDEFLVCRYDPPGNVLGESPFVEDGGTAPPPR